MKIIACTLLLALSLLSFAMPQPTTAQNNGPSANGKFQFSMDDGRTRYVEFDARAQADGHARGQMTFNDPEAPPSADVDGTGGPSSNSGPVGIFIKAEFDCLVVSGQRAVMGGIIRESSVPDAVGQRVLLVVEDNGEGIDAPTRDKLTWGVYKRVGGDWTPQDAERPGDDGATLTWIARDAERPDDEGVPFRRNETVGCQSFPLSSYAFVDVRHGDGNIQVRP